MSAVIRVLHWDKFWIPSQIKEKIVEEALNSAHIMYNDMFLKG